MPTTMSPLRYPGGKTKLYTYVKEILNCNGLLGQTYIEPFAGGAGLAIKLLLNGDMKRIVINDFDPSIYYFWHSILNTTDDFCHLVFKTDITTEEWQKQRAIYLKQDTTNPLELGFATFFLNRTNISGVIKGGIIGGINQTGTHAMTARFNKENLVSKIREIAAHKEQIIVYNLDAQEFLLPKYMRCFYKSFINFDPPYVKKGAKLYKNSFNEKDHRDLSEKISQCERKWIVTYDICPLVADLYSDYRYGFLDLTYSINQSKKAQEYIFFSNNLILPERIDYYLSPVCTASIKAI
ncbi:MAG: DNA adenine methylase [Gracilibacteraceae bacterium]|nr:DNA adenine methylase [Gracilibacteraceae bacterium]